ncbi:dTMP kinase [Nocardia puris]|uniref:Thymidylate kinase n=1 Tax=Nocardia puris TaxID=208602 RepID=A0A366DMN0_9NOCA|nr:dTMP kinase [Nocardia puris]RBO91353.1 thymidylate kinase [Nocardia puris]
MTGVFVTFDGPGAAGKSTLIRAVADALTRRGIAPVTTCSPTRTPLGDQLRAGTHTYRGMAMACLIAGDRHHQLVTEIEPAITAGRIVLCDRFLPSSLVLQGGIDGIDSDVIWHLHRGIWTPDLAILLRAEVPVLEHRLALRGAHSRYEQQPGSSRTESELFATVAADLRRKGWPIAEVDTTRRSCENIAAMLVDHILHLHTRRTSA